MHPPAARLVTQLTIHVAVWLLTAGTGVAQSPPREAQIDCGTREVARNQPRGFTCIAYRSFDEPDNAAWRQEVAAGVEVETAKGSGVPDRAARALKLRFPKGMVSPAPGAAAYRLLPKTSASYSAVYMSFRLKLPDGWKGPLGNLDNVLVLSSGPSPEQSISLALYGFEGGKVRPALRLAGLNQPFQGRKDPVLGANLDSGLAMAPDRWHHWEIVVRNGDGDADGRIEWWVDGRAMGRYSGFDFWPGAVPRIWSVEWRTLISHIALHRRLTYLLSHILVSGFESSAPIVALVIAPKVVSLAPGGTTTFTAVGKRLNGTTITVPVSYSATGGTINPAGQYQAGLADGTYEVRATLGSLFDVASVTVASPQVAGVDKIEAINDATISSGVTGPETVLLLDARRSAADVGGSTDECTNDYIVHGRSVSFQDLRKQDGTCKTPDGQQTMPDEIVVFSVDDSVVIDQGPAATRSIWTNATGESRTEDLKGGGLRHMPLRIWLASSTANTLYDNDVREASRMFNENRVGVEFSVYGGSATSIGTAGDWCPTAIPASYTPGMINVYYVPYLSPPGAAAPARGVNCRTLDWRIVYISVAQYHNTTLAHELGHVLGLEHSGEGKACNSGAWYGMSFPEDNLMWSGCTGGATFSLGQAYRMNVEALSELVKLGLQTGPKRACECRFWNSSCGSSDFTNWLNFVNESMKDDAECPAVFRNF